MPSFVQNLHQMDASQLASIRKFLPARLYLKPFAVQQSLDVLGQHRPVRPGAQRGLDRLETEPQCIDFVRAPRRRNGERWRRHRARRNRCARRRGGLKRGDVRGQRLDRSAVCEQLGIQVDDVVRTAEVDRPAMFEEERAPAESFHHGGVVRNEQQSHAAGKEEVDGTCTLELKPGVPDGQRLIDDQDVRFDVSGHRKGETDNHAAGVSLDRLLDEIADLRIRGDGLLAGFHFAPA